MAQPARPSPKWRFDDFEVNPRAAELRKHGIHIKLHGQSFQILVMLLEQPGEVVTRDEMRHKLWPAGTFVDFEHSLNSAIKKLRQALGDSADAPKFIETTPRLGYRFIVRVDELPAAAAAVEPNSGLGSIAAIATPRRRLHEMAFVAAMFLVLAGAGYFGWRHFRLRAQPPAGKIMLAMLPFQNLTGDPNQDYLSDGLTEEMITELGGLQPERLGVIARTSVMQYKRSDKPVGQIGRELGVQYLVEGSVRREAGRVRISAQLIQVKDQSHLWAQGYDRSPGDILSFENEVAQAIAQQIHINLTDKRVATTAKRPPSPEVLNFYLQGRNYWNKRDDEGLTKAVSYFQQAIKLDPEFAPAYAGLADSYAVIPLLVPSASQFELYPKAKEAASRALTLDEHLSEAHNSMAYARLYLDWDFAEVEKEFQRALELNPSYATAHQWHAEFLSLMGRHQQAIAEIERAQQLDPLSFILYLQAGNIFQEDRQYDRAIKEYRKGLTLNPNFVSLLYGLGSAHRRQGMYEQYLAEMQLAAKAKNDATFIRWVDALQRAYTASGERGIWIHQLESPPNWHRPAFYFASGYAMVGDKERAFYWLEQAFRQRDSEILNLRNMPELDSLHPDPRFADLVRRIGLPP